MSKLELGHESLIEAGFRHNDVVISGKRYYKKELDGASLMYVEGEGLTLSFYDRQLKDIAGLRLTPERWNEIKEAVSYFHETNNP